MSMKRNQVGIILIFILIHINIYLYFLITHSTTTHFLLLLTQKLLFHTEICVYVVFKLKLSCNGFHLDKRHFTETSHISTNRAPVLFLNQKHCQVFLLKVQNYSQYNPTVLKRSDSIAQNEPLNGIYHSITCMQCWSK